MGLSKVLTDEKPGHGYVELGAGMSSIDGPFAFGEVGQRISENQSLFVRGQADRNEASVVGGWEWKW